MPDANSPAAPPPAWSPSSDGVAHGVTIATYGAQALEAGSLADFIAWGARVDELEDGPDIIERATFRDAAGWENEVRIAYWRDAGAFARWVQSDQVAGWWEHLDRLAGAVGVWRELFWVPSDRVETILSAPSIEIGSARLSKGVRGPIDEHGYWGSMRDRLAVSRSDALASSWGEELEARTSDNGPGQRIIVEAPENLTLIRSGQDTAKCVPDELEEYCRFIRPVLQRGMNFLRDNPVEAGCCSCRFMIELNADGTESQRSFGFAWFLTLGHLERWSKSHPTHLAIYNVFSNFAKRRADILGLELWHEVAVIPSDRRLFEYVNCHPGTGLLGFFPQTRIG